MVDIMGDPFNFSGISSVAFAMYETHEETCIEW